MTLGIQATLDVTVDPAWRQRADYQNDGLWGSICYHVVQPSHICGGGGAVKTMTTPRAAKFPTSDYSSSQDVREGFSNLSEAIL